MIAEYSIKVTKIFLNYVGEILDMNNTDDSAFLHTFTLLLLGLTAVGIFAFILAGTVADRAESEQPVERSELERTKPAGNINTQENSIEVASIGSLNPAEIGQEQSSLS